MSSNIETTLAQFKDYVLKQEDIPLAFLVGSQARTSMPADAWSDIDVVLITEEPAKYLDDSLWLKNLDLVPIITFLEITAVGDQRERRVLFQNGVDVDFSVFPISQFKLMINSGLVPAEIATGLRRGILPLKDDENLLGPLQKGLEATNVSNAASSQPWSLSEQDFKQSTSDFLYHFVWIARKLRRGELWTAKMCNDCYMKRLLLQMIEWYMHSKKGSNYDTWHSGRFIEKWAEEWIVKDLRSTFGDYEIEGIRSSLYSTVKLYSRLAKDVSRDLKFEYPVKSEEFAWIQARSALGQ
jgi:aminoglycoside 6-adenylyltransferase